MKELFILAILVESLTNIVKSVYEDGQVNKTVILSIVVGLVVAFTTGLDLLGVVGLSTHVPYVGVALTGVIVSRGANFVHDLFEQIG